MKSSIRNEIKAQIVRAGYTMQEVVDLLHNEYGWSDSVSNPVSYTHLTTAPQAQEREVQWQKQRASF